MQAIAEAASGNARPGSVEQDFPRKTAALLIERRFGLSGCSALTIEQDPEEFTCSNY
jgi:hypothetical protein